LILVGHYVRKFPLRCFRIHADGEVGRIIRRDSANTRHIDRHIVARRRHADAQRSMRPAAIRKASLRRKSTISPAVRNFSGLPRHRRQSTVHCIIPSASASVRTKALPTTDSKRDATDDVSVALHARQPVLCMGLVRMRVRAAFPSGKTLPDSQASRIELRMHAAHQRKIGIGKHHVINSLFSMPTTILAGQSRRDCTQYGTISFRARTACLRIAIDPADQQHQRCRLSIPRMENISDLDPARLAISEPAAELGAISNVESPIIIVARRRAVPSPRQIHLPPLP